MRDALCPERRCAKDPPNMAGSRRVWLEPLQPSAPPRVCGVGVRPRVDQAVAVGWAATQVAALLHGLGPHRRQHPKPGPQHLPFGLSTQQHHQCLMSRIGTVNWAMGLR
jgi:hypothetical protein